MFARVSALACLVLSAAAVRREGSGGAAPQLYTCQSGQCVVNSRGLPLSECQAGCTPPPSANYTCQSGQCVVSNRGLPQAECAQVCGGPGPPPSPSPMNIVQLAASVPELSMLVTALKAANLTSALSGQGPFTVFAPTNAAFAAQPQVYINVALLEYHVASGSVYSKDLANHERLKTLEGESVEITLLNGTVFVDRSRVLKADNAASNGVVHIIGKLLEPLEPSAPQSSAPIGN